MSDRQKPVVGVETYDPHRVVRNRRRIIGQSHNLTGIVADSATVRASLVKPPVRTIRLPSVPRRRKKPTRNSPRREGAKSRGTGGRRHARRHTSRGDHQSTRDYITTKFGEQTDRIGESKQLTIPLAPATRVCDHDSITAGMGFAYSTI